ncbi:MAG: bifunctional adenosylcobinamide kinase/adenosylcobinamide-phosphate guanylyltransferase [Lachnospiraceae bacterium]
MRLIIGGSYQGKFEYAKKIAGNGGIILNGWEEEIDFANVKIWNNFHLWIKKHMNTGIDMQKAVKMIVEKNPDIIIIMDEIGSGVVPINKVDRDFRETAGRIGCFLAQSANEVHRVVCGIGTVIK